MPFIIALGSPSVPGGRASVYLLSAVCLAGAGIFAGESRENGDISYRLRFPCGCPPKMAMSDERSEEFRHFGSRRENGAC